MPPLPSPGAVIKADLLFTVGTDAQALSRFYINYTGTPPTDASLTTFASLLNAECDDALPPLMHPDTTYDGCTLRDLGSDTGLEMSFPETSVGSRSGDALGADVAVLINMHIGRHYRGGKPRGYIPLGTATDLQTRQTWTTDFQDAAGGTMSDVYGAMDGSSVDGCTAGVLVNVSYYGPPNRYLGTAPGRIRTVSTVREVPIVDIVTTTSMNIKLGSQRRRNLIRS
jgi:hypothetical protein